MTSKNNRAPLLCHVRLCAPFQSYWRIQSSLTLKFDRRPWETVRRLFPASSNCVHRFVVINALKLDLQSVNAQLGYKSAFLSRVPLNLDGWPWKTIGHLSYATSSFVQSGNTHFGSKSAIFCPVVPWNLADDLEKWYSTIPFPHQALCIISSPHVNLDLWSGNGSIGFWPL